MELKNNIIINSDNWSVMAYKNHQIFFRGFFYYNGKFVKSEELISKLHDKILENNISFSSEKLSEFLKELDGNYALIIKSVNKMILIVDRVRSIPLFYRKTNNSMHITDKNNVISEWDFISMNEFMLTGYVTGNNTLDKYMKQVEAGTYIIIEKNEIYKKSYYQFNHIVTSRNSSSFYTSKLATIINNVFKRLKESIPSSSTIYLPLSGGYDSRIIAIMLKEHGFNNIVSYTYGTINNPQARKSKEVAEYLGFKWEFIEYTEQMWEHLRHSEKLNNYFDMSFNLVSVPHLQDFLAISQLKKKYGKGVVIPGHTGDFVAGSHLTKNIYNFSNNSNLNDEIISDEIFKNHYYLWTSSSEKLKHELKERIITNTQELITLDPNENKNEIFANNYEYWEWKERQSKFIINSLKVYDFYSLESRIPLWDLEILNFFEKLPIELRFEKQLYNETLEGMYPRLFPKGKDEKSSKGVQLKKEIYKNRRIRYYSQVKYAKSNHFLKWFSMFEENELKKSIIYNNNLYRWPNHFNSILVFDILKKIQGGD